MSRNRRIKGMIIAAVLIVCISLGTSAPAGIKAAEEGAFTIYAAGQDTEVPDVSELSAPDGPVGDVDTITLSEDELSGEEIKAILEQLRREDSKSSRKAPAFNAADGSLDLNSGSGTYGYNFLNDFGKAAYDALERKMSTFVADEGYVTDTYASGDKIYASLSGRKGYHVDLFFDPFVYNDVAKNIYDLVIWTAKLDPSKIEFRPTNTQAIKLPLGIHATTGRRCWYLDPVSLEPIEDIEYIYNIEKIPADLIREIRASWNRRRARSTRSWSRRCRARRGGSSWS